jgi:hypothetical protein
MQIDLLKKYFDSLLSVIDNIGLRVESSDCGAGILVVVVWKKLSL